MLSSLTSLTYRRLSISSLSTITMAAAIAPGSDLSKIPLAQNPNGSPPNFVNPPSQSGTDLAVGLPFAVFSACFVLLRLITNFRHTGKLGLDDCECPIASQDMVGSQAHIADLCLFAHVMMTVYFTLGVACKCSNLQWTSKARF